MKINNYKLRTSMTGKYKAFFNY